MRAGVVRSGGVGRLKLSGPLWLLVREEMGLLGVAVAFLWPWGLIEAVGAEAEVLVGGGGGGGTGMFPRPYAARDL